MVVYVRTTYAENHVSSHGKPCVERGPRTVVGQLPDAVIGRSLRVTIYSTTAKPHRQINSAGTAKLVALASSAQGSEGLSEAGSDRIADKKRVRIETVLCDCCNKMQCLRARAAGSSAKESSHNGTAGMSAAGGSPWRFADTSTVMRPMGVRSVRFKSGPPVQEAWMLS